MSDEQDALNINVPISVKSQLALAFIVKNEGHYAIKMIKSVLPVVGFISCVDTGSTDGTMDLIKGLLESSGTPYALRQEEFVSFGASRNSAIDQVPAQFDWILMLDADEVFIEQDLRKFADLINQTEFDAWLIPRYNWIDKIGGTYSLHYPDYQGRLFRHSNNSVIRYDGVIHEGLSGYAKIGTIEPSGLTPSDPHKEIHIHHIKLFTKPHQEIASREAQYREILSRHTIRNELITKIWQGKEPFAAKSSYSGRVDFQGWASDNPLLTRAINEVKPRIVVEVGVWKGGSVITMGQAMKALGLDGAIIAIDTWLGAWDHWIQPIWFESLQVEGGYPTLFKTFAANILESNLQDIVVPLPLDSLNAATVLKSKGIRPNVVHIDGAHDYHSVFADLRAWWPLLTPGGVMLGDDYHASGDTWPEVRAAFHDFFRTDTLENLGGKCYIQKLGE